MVKVKTKVKGSEVFYYHAAVVVKVEEKEMVIDPETHTVKSWDKTEWIKHSWANITHCDKTTKAADLEELCNKGPDILEKEKNWLTTCKSKESKYFLNEKKELALFTKAIPPFILYKAFWQKASPNCPSIAVIKAALNIYGSGGIYTKSGDNYTLKDGSKITLTKEEIENAKLHMGIENDDTYADEEFMTTVYTCYAIIAKNFPAKCKINNDCEKLETTDYDSVLAYMEENGYLARNAPEYLGLGKKIPTLLGGTADEEGVFAWGKAHCVYASDGSCDKWGMTKSFGLFSRWRYWYPKRIRLK